MGDVHPTQLDTLADDEALEDFDYFLAVKDKPRRVVNVTDEVRKLISDATHLLTEDVDG